jgi:hypothetical protein
MAPIRLSRSAGMRLFRACAAQAQRLVSPREIDLPQGWDAEDHLYPARVRVKVPLSAAMSKNRMWVHTRRGVVSSREAHNCKEALIAEVRAAAAAGGVHFFRNKVWVDLLVRKASHAMDCVNILDLVADGLKIAIGLDDNWFSVRRIDWEVRPADPHVVVGVLQQTCVDGDVCRECGEVRLPEMFPAVPRNKGGRGTTCVVCTTAAAVRRGREPRPTPRP